MAAAPHQSLEDLVRRMTPVTAPPDQRADVVALSRALGALPHKGRRRVPACRLIGPEGESIAIPEAVFRVLERVVDVMARGVAITIVPVGRELTTQQAADLINVSRQYLVRLLEEGRIPFIRTGKHRRLRIEDVLAFKAQRDRERGEALTELTNLSEEFGGYGELK